MTLPPPASGSTCLVTGASSGIGAEIARELAARGHGVALAARREDRLRELADELVGRHRVRVEVFGSDVADAAAREALASGLEERGLAVEVLVNNAGFGTAGPYEALDQARELEMVRTNVEAVVALCGVYLPAMVERGRGAVLNLASTAAFQPLPVQATYAATKAFVLSYSEALHAEMRPKGVTVTALCPGPVRTEFASVAGLSHVEDASPGAVWMTADEVARAGVRGLERGRRVVVPGVLNRVGAMGGQHVPRSVLLPLARRLHPGQRRPGQGS